MGAEVNLPAGKLWGLPETDLREIQESLAELGEPDTEGTEATDSRPEDPWHSRPHPCRAVAGDPGKFGGVGVRGA